MKTIIEANIPYIQGLIEPYSEVEYLESEDITPEAVRDADALLVRTRTRCDEALLGGSRVTFVGTATIGLDHIDLPWCAAHGIEAVNAPGCNAPAVAQWVLAVVARMMTKTPADTVLGIVGVGHVGSIVENWARAIGFNVLRCDPPRRRAEGGDFIALNELIARADIVTLHTPLYREGPDATYHLVDARLISALRPNAILLNAARGAIFHTEEVLRALSARPDVRLAIDCWEGEPQLNEQLLRRAEIATPHIAGYSLEGKHRATSLVVSALARHFGLPIDLGYIDMGTASRPSLQRIAQSYDPMPDDRALRAEPTALERLRNRYPLRPEP